MEHIGNSHGLLPSRQTLGHLAMAMGFPWQNTTSVHGFLQGMSLQLEGCCRIRKTVNPTLKSLRTFIRENLGPAPKNTGTVPIPSIYGILSYIWLIFVINVGKYTSHMDGMGWIMKAKKNPTSTSRIVMMTYTFPTWSRFERQAPSDDIATTKQTNGYERFSLAPHRPAKYWLPEMFQIAYCKLS